MSTPGTDLTDLQRRILDFEQRWWRLAGLKEDAITEEFGFGAVRYHQLLAATLAHPAALAYSPVLVNRLNRITQARADRRHPGEP